MPPDRAITTERPLLGVSAIVWQQDKVLLVKRRNPPLQGLWSLPGGLVEAGEYLAKAAEREVLEETAITIGDTAQIDQVEIIGHRAGGGIAYHYVLAIFSASYRSGDIHAGDDAADARWVAKMELAGLALTEDTERMIRAHGPE